MTGTKLSGNSFVVNTETLECREAVQPGPQFGLPIVEKLRLGLQKCREEISIAVLILAPVLKVLWELVPRWVTWVLRVGLQISVDCDMPTVPNLLREIRGIEDELGLQESVIVGLGQETKIQSQVEIWQTLAQKPAIVFLEDKLHMDWMENAKKTTAYCILHSGKEGYKNLLRIFTSWWQKLVRFVTKNHKNLSKSNNV